MRAIVEHLAHMDDPPTVSVVVPARDRRDLLRGLLHALDEQTYDDFEVIVVDDHSTEDLEGVVEGRFIGGRPVRYVRAQGRGAVAARTEGVAAAWGSILAFTDSDCVPSPSWLEAGVREIEQGADVCNGPTRPTRPPRPRERTMWSGTEGLYPTCNVFFDRAAFEAAGGFDADAARRLGFRMNDRAKGLGFGEDTLLAWRVARAGRAAFAEDAVVEHHVFPPDECERLSRAWMAAAFPALVREVPELHGRLIFKGFRLGRRTRTPAYTTTVLFAVGGPFLAMFGLAWWAVARLKDVRGMSGDWRTRLRAVPFEMAEDAVTATALLVGSVRARKLVL